MDKEQPNPVIRWLNIDPGDGRWIMGAYLILGAIAFGIGALDWWWIIFPGYIGIIICMMHLDKYTVNPRSERETDDI